MKLSTTKSLNTKQSLIRLYHNKYNSDLQEHNPINNNYKSLFEVINNTSTSIGKRYLKNRLLNPIINIDISKQGN